MDKKEWGKEKMKSKNNIGYILLVLFMMLVVVIIVFGVQWDALRQESIHKYKPFEMSNSQKAAMLDINILCTNQHNHPLLKGQDICIYIPNLKERIKQLQ